MLFRSYRPGEGGPLLQNAAYHAAATKTHLHLLDAKVDAAGAAALDNWLRLPASERRPDVLQKTLDAAKTSILAKDAGDADRPYVETKWARIAGHAQRVADKDAYDRQMDEARAATLANLSTANDAAHRLAASPQDRKSTRLKSSHVSESRMPSSA